MRGACACASFGSGRPVWAARNGSAITSALDTQPSSPPQHQPTQSYSFASVSPTSEPAVALAAARTAASCSSEVGNAASASSTAWARAWRVSGERRLGKQVVRAVAALGGEGRKRGRWGSGSPCYRTSVAGRAHVCVCVCIGGCGARHACKWRTRHVLACGCRRGAVARQMSGQSGPGSRHALGAVARSLARRQAVGVQGTQREVAQHA